MEDLKEKFEQVKENANRIRVTRDVYGDMLSFYEELLYLQLKDQAKIKLEVPKLSDEIIKTKLDEGFPLLNREDFPVDFEAAVKLLRQIREIIPEENSELRKCNENLVKFLEDFGSTDLFWKNLLEGNEKDLQETAEKIASPVQQVIFLGVSAIKPSLWYVRAKFANHVPPDFPWRKNYCPICGSLPSLLLLKEKEGRKYGSCAWCEHQWLMNRIECPYCLNQLQESLGYIAIEDDEVYRVEYCESCKHYFKLIDCRPLEVEPVPPLEEFTTLHLDMLAQEKGYKMPPSLSPAVYGENEKS